MKKLFLLASLLVCFGALSGCTPEVADQSESEFQGEDAEAQMKAMEEVK